MSEYYKKYRPKSLRSIIGQDNAVASLTSLVDRQAVPHFLLLTGPSGCGKTTIARIMKDLLGCGDADFIEKNCADFKGIDTVREIRKHVNLRPMDGECRIYLVDEAHKLTPDAQEAFLKMLEDTPDHAYFILATTDPDKLKKTIHTRATEIKLNAVSGKNLERVVWRVVKKEELGVGDHVVTEIADAADGSPRKALVLLEQVGSLEDEAAQLEAIKVTTFDKVESINLARALMFGKASWAQVAAILRGLQDQDAEGIRYMVLGYANSVLLGKGKGIPASGPIAGKCFQVLEIFGDNFYSSKMPGLTAACYEVVTK
jgi:DNA polymerase-3 subunit gamma/tau